MSRPPSIIWFERLYLAAVALGLVSLVWTSPEMQHEMANRPTALPHWVMPATLVIANILSIALW